MAWCRLADIPVTGKPEVTDANFKQGCHGLLRVEAETFCVVRNKTDAPRVGLICLARNIPAGYAVHG